MTATPSSKSVRRRLLVAAVALLASSMPVVTGGAAPALAAETTCLTMIVAGVPVTTCVDGGGSPGGSSSTTYVTHCYNVMGNLYWGWATVTDGVPDTSNCMPNDPGILTGKCPTGYRGYYLYTVNDGPDVILLYLDVYCTVSVYVEPSGIIAEKAEIVAKDVPPGLDASPDGVLFDRTWYAGMRNFYPGGGEVSATAIDCARATTFPVEGTVRLSYSRTIGYLSNGRELFTKEGYITVKTVCEGGGTTTWGPELFRDVTINPLQYGTVGGSYHPFTVTSRAGTPYSRCVGSCTDATLRTPTLVSSNYSLDAVGTPGYGECASPVDSSCAYWEAEAARDSVTVHAYHATTGDERLNFQLATNELRWIQYGRNTASWTDCYAGLVDGVPIDQCVDRTVTTEVSRLRATTHQTPNAPMPVIVIGSTATPGTGR